MFLRFKSNYDENWLKMSLRRPITHLKHVSKYTYETALRYGNDDHLQVHLKYGQDCDSVYDSCSVFYELIMKYRLSTVNRED